MASYRLSDKADEDLSRLYEYGILHYGQERADRYSIPSPITKS